MHKKGSPPATLEQLLPKLVTGPSFPLLKGLRPGLSTEVGEREVTRRLQLNLEKVPYQH